MTVHLSQRYELIICIKAASDEYFENVLEILIQIKMYLKFLQVYKIMLNKPKITTK